MSILPVGYTWNKEDLPATRYGGVSSIVNTEVNGERGLIWTAVWQRMKNDNLTVSQVQVDSGARFCCRSPTRALLAWAKEKI